MLKEIHKSRTVIKYEKMLKAYKEYEDAVKAAQDQFILDIYTLILLHEQAVGLDTKLFMIEVTVECGMCQVTTYLTCRHPEVDMWKKIKYLNAYSDLQSISLLIQEHVKELKAVQNIILNNI